MRRCSDTMDCAICLGRPVHCEWTEPYAWAGPFTLPRLTRSADLGVVVVGLGGFLVLVPRYLVQASMNDCPHDQIGRSVCVWGRGGAGAARRRAMSEG